MTAPVGAIVDVSVGVAVGVPVGVSVGGIVGVVVIVGIGVDVLVAVGELVETAVGVWVAVETLVGGGVSVAVGVFARPPSEPPQAARLPAIDRHTSRQLVTRHHRRFPRVVVSSRHPVRSVIGSLIGSAVRLAFMRRIKWETVP